MNPFEQQPMKVQDGIVDWATLYPKPYDKRTVDPYTKIRVILMNGIEVEAIIFQARVPPHVLQQRSAERDRSNSPD
jgi:hypothetical protein